MSRQNFNDGQEIIQSDYNELQARLQQELYDRIIYELVQRQENAFFNNSFLPSYSTATVVTINQGTGFQTDSSVDPEEPEKRLLYRASSVNVNLSAPDSVNDRIDLIVVKAALVDGDTESRKFKNATTSVITDEDLVISKEWEAEVIAVTGTPAVSPVAPAVPSGYIKVAECYVNAVSGMSGSGDVTDTRVVMPIGSEATINTLGYSRLTAGAAVTLDQLMQDIDSLLVNGLLDDNIFEDLVSDPAAPANNLARKIYNKGGVLYYRESTPEGGAVIPLGSGAGGGGGAKWEGDALAPVKEFEFGNPAWKFDVASANQELYMFLRVPSGYLAGRQIKAYVPVYSPSTANEFQFRVVSTLIRINQDGLDSSTNTNTSDSGDITNSGAANKLVVLEFDLTTALGQINGFSVQAGDIIKLKLTRIAPTGTEDSAEVRVVDGATEVKFS